MTLIAAIMPLAVATEREVCSRPTTAERLMSPESDKIHTRHSIIEELSVACGNAIRVLNEPDDFRLRLLTEMVRLELARVAAEAPRPDKPDEPSEV